MVRATSMSPVLFLTAALALPHHAAAESASMHQYVTCAVYYRMLVGAFNSRGQDLDLMAEMSRERLEVAMKLAREVGAAEYGEEMAEEIFLEQWQDTLAGMTDEINRNYNNISRIKYKYKDRCEQLIPAQE